MWITRIVPGRFYVKLGKCLNDINYGSNNDHIPKVIFTVILCHLVFFCSNLLQHARFICCDKLAICGLLQTWLFLGFIIVYVYPPCCQRDRKCNTGSMQVIFDSD